MSKKIIITTIIVLVLALGGLFGYKQLTSRRSVENSDNANQDIQTQKLNGVSINGTFVEEALASRRPLGVMVENLPASRPQSGLSEAEVVYEALAEGGITRYLALFQTTEAKSIGPVRSARSYYAAIAGSWEALYAHVGGSPEALEGLAQGSYANVIDLNQFYNGQFFERVSSRSAPHNVYTSTAKLQEFLGAQSKWPAVRRSQFEFKDDESFVKTKQGAGSIILVPAYNIFLDFSTAEYRVKYIYDGEKNVYARFVGGKKDTDAGNGNEIIAKTVVVQLVTVLPVPNDPAFRVNVQITGKGRAYIFMDGQVVEGNWERLSGGRTVFRDVSGKEISINRGPVWVELIPNSKLNAVLWDAAVVNPDGSVTITPPPPPVKK